MVHVKPRRRSPLWIALLGASALVLTWMASAQPAPKKQATDPSKDKPNAVQHEMRLLEAALQQSVAAIGKGDVKALPRKLHAVHLAAGDTEKELKSGRYKLPRGNDNVAAFIAMDEAFHKVMIKMVKAAKKNDVPTTSKHFGDLMTRCHGCHAQFKDPPAAPSAKKR